MTTAHSEGAAARAATLKALLRVSEPVLVALSEGKLKARMPVEALKESVDREKYTYLEALGRLLAGIAPWLELGPDDTEEGKLRQRYIDLAAKAVGHAVDPQSPDYMNFNSGAQPLVDTAFLAHGLLRAPRQLWARLDKEAQARTVAAFKLTRVITPGRTNWLLFSAMVEAFLWNFTGECELAPIETAVNEHLEWYVGDGTYSDGPPYHWDYYNSFVIQPMLLDILRICAEKKHPLGDRYPLTLERAQRYAVVQERMISPEGTFPIVGRSSTYRFGAFQTLSQMALEHHLPDSLAPGAVRAGLTAVIERMISAPGTFDDEGWLRLGVVGHQPAQAELYISTGSLYLCSVGLLHLGLPPNDPFWTEPDQPWTQKRLWRGEDLPADHSIKV
jgi:hypothetical protein